MNMYYSAPLSKLTDSAGNPLQSIPKPAYGDVLPIVFTALDADNAPIDLSAATKWKLTVDVDRTIETKPVSEVLPENITYDPEAKTLSFTINMKTLEFFLAVNGKSQVVLISELCGYDSSDTSLFRFPWNMIGVMPVGGGDAPDPVTTTADYTAFEIYANSEEIPAGTDHPDLGYITVAIPAMMTEKFMMRANYQHADSDVIVNWGDGSTSTLRNGEFESEDLSEWDKEHQFEAITVMSHTYAEPGKYIVKIYGKKYFGLANSRTLENNLICRCLDNDLPLASNVNNLANYARSAKRLVNLCIPTAMNLWNIENFHIIFQDCVNLQYAYGLKRKIRIPRAATGIFRGCSALIQTDLVLPVTNVDASSEPTHCFRGCSSLVTPIQNLLPSAGFTNHIMQVDYLFNGCSSLTGTVPAAILWEDTSKVWQGTATAFQGASDAIRAQVPASWGGTNTEIVV